MRLFIFSLTIFAGAALPACSTAYRIKQVAKKHLLEVTETRNSHIGIALYDPSKQEILFDHNGSSYFTPASNTKIVTCYAAMKHLGDSIAGMHYAESETSLHVRPTGDPTLLHRDFDKQPVIDLLKRKGKPVIIETQGWKSAAWGSGWSWDDYDQGYMPERSPLPVYGNILEWHQQMDSTSHVKLPSASPAVSIYSIPEVNWKVRFDQNEPNSTFSVTRSLHENEFLIREGKEKNKTQNVPFITYGAASAVSLLKDSLPLGIRISDQPEERPSRFETVFTRPLDSVLQPMMHRSDNFFAEQLLLMVSEKMLGVMDVNQVIDSILRSDLSDLPQPPRWADGSGLSRYNLFSPKDILSILNKIEIEFGMERVKTIFPSGGEGTISTLYLTDKEKIYAKTGTLSGVVALSGYLFTHKGKWVLFSIMINHHRGNATSIRKKIEQFVTDVRKRL